MRCHPKAVSRQLIGLDIAHGAPSTGSFPQPVAGVLAAALLAGHKSEGLGDG
jgi:hypothetical protein